MEPFARAQKSLSNQGQEKHVAMKQDLDYYYFIFILCPVTLLSHFLVPVDSGQGMWIP